MFFTELKVGHSFMIGDSKITIVKNKTNKVLVSVDADKDVKIKLLKDSDPKN